jgi:16S rRNA (cytosine967-C5)-methyltransferase
VKNKIYVDYIIKSFYKKDISKLDSILRTALRASITELVILKRKPYAVLHSWVEIVKKRNIGASKLLNAILRNILRKGADEPKEEYIKFSLPLWFYKKLKREFGKDFLKRLYKWYHSEPPYYFRIYFDRDEEKIRETVERKFLQKNFFISRLRFPPFAYKSFYHPWEVELEEKYYYVQDFSSQSVCHILEPFEIREIWDLTSAPGGKSLYISFLKMNRIKIFATELNKKRAIILKKNFKKYRINGKVTIADVTYFLPKKNFDKVIIDAPCSGLGTLRKKPEILLRMNEEKIRILKEIQLKLLKNGFKALKKGGIMLYITCTITREENYELIKEFSNKYPVEILTPSNVPSFLIKQNHFFCDGIEMDSDFMYGFIMRKL